MKDKAFAAAVNRDDIKLGAEELGIPLEKHIEVVLQGMKKVAKEIGL
jgi:predicted hydrolase (HD superfamily)